MSPFFGEPSTQMGPGSCPSSERRDVSNPLPEETFAHGLSLAGASGCGGALAAGTSHDIEVAAEGGQVVTCRPIALEYTRFVK